LAKYPDIIPALYGMLTPPQTADFVPPLQWTTSTDKEIARLLCDDGFQVSAGSIPSLLRHVGLRAHPTVRIPKNRPSPTDKQFDFIHRFAGEALRVGQRVYFVDFCVKHGNDADAYTSMVAYKNRCKYITNFIIEALGCLWYDLRDKDSTPMIVLEGGSFLGIANDYFHDRLKKLVREAGFNVLLSYLPNGISHWSRTERIYEDCRKVAGEQTLEEVFITVDDIQMEHRLPSGTGDASTLRQQFCDESKDLGLCDWNRAFGKRKIDDATAADLHTPEIMQK